MSFLIPLLSGCSTSDSVISPIVEAPEPPNEDPVDFFLDDADTKFIGEDGSDEAGSVVAAAGDLDGDGLADLLVGAAGSGSNGYLSGSTYVFFGPPPSGKVPLEEADAQLVGENERDRSGFSIAGVGDTDGDGLGDLWIGAYEADIDLKENYEGAAYLLRETPQGEVNLGSAALLVRGEYGAQQFGYAVASAGDVDGDGLMDLLAGNYGRSGAYLFYGNTSGEVTTADADVEFLVRSSAYSSLGRSLSSAGDMDGDGLSEVLLGMRHKDEETGDESSAVFVVSVPLGGEADVEDVGFRLLGGDDATSDPLAVAGNGDANGDGYPDILVGAGKHSSQDMIENGVAWLVLGPVTEDQNLGDAETIFYGPEEYDEVGNSVAFVGDIDGDRDNEVLIGAENSGESSQGSAYLFLSDIDEGVLPLESADYRLRGSENYDRAGSSVVGLGDVDGDYLADLLIGASEDDEGGIRAGAAYLVSGSNF
jgi:hypothetical protein